MKTKMKKAEIGKAGKRNLVGDGSGAFSVTSVRNFDPESRRDSIVQPRVASLRATLGRLVESQDNPERVESRGQDATLSGLGMICGSLPGVAAARQPRAERCNPFGIVLRQLAEVATRRQPGVTNHRTALAFRRQHSETSTPCRLKAAFPSPTGFHFPAFPLSAFRRTAAFTLIEIMIVVIIIGVLAATIIPQFMGTTHDAKVSASKGHVAELEAAIERFNIHMDRYPSVEEGLKVLTEPPTGEESKWRGPYVKQLRPDPWGNPYQYRAPGIHHSASFDLWSRGADNADGGDGQGADIGNW